MSEDGQIQSSEPPSGTIRILPPEPPSPEVIRAIEQAAAKEIIRDGPVQLVAQNPDKPLELYLIESNMPYAAALVGLDTYAVEEGDVRDRVRLIDEYIRAELNHKGLKPLLGPYKEVYEKVAEVLGINSYVDKYTAIEKMYVYLKRAVEDRRLFLKVGLQYGEKPTLKDLSLDELRTILK